jgi:hypothetical protein
MAPAQPAGAPPPVELSSAVYQSQSAPAALPNCEQRATPSPCVQPPDAYRHDGLYFRISNGFGYAAFSGSGPSGDASIHQFSPGSGALLAIGGTPTEGLVVAGALRAVMARGRFHGGPQPEHNATANNAQLGVLVDWFPQPTGGWHVGALAGLGVIAVVDSDIKDSNGLGFGGSLFGGYDFWIGAQWSLGLQAVFSATSSTALKDSDRDDTGYKLGALSAGLEYTFTLH